MAARLTSSSWAWDLAMSSSWATAVAPHSGAAALKRSRTCPARPTVCSISAASRPGRGWRRALAHHQLRRDDDAHRVARAAADLLEQQREAAPPDLVEVLADAGQRRRVERGLGHVVEADDAHVAGHAAPALVQRAQQAEGHRVVGDEDRRRVAVVQQLLAEDVARLRAPVAHELGGDRRARLAQGRAPALDAAAGLQEVARAREVEHGLVAE